MQDQERFAAVKQEIARAEARFGSYTSTHEALGVLMEECDELRDAIHRNAIDEVRAEAIQIAAVTLRLAECCSFESFRERSGE